MPHGAMFVAELIRSNNGNSGIPGIKQQQTPGVSMAGPGVISEVEALAVLYNQDHESKKALHHWRRVLRIAKSTLKESRKDNAALAGTYHMCTLALRCLQWWRARVSLPQGLPQRQGLPGRQRLPHGGPVLIEGLSSAYPAVTNQEPRDPLGLLSKPRQDQNQNQDQDNDQDNEVVQGVDDDLSQSLRELTQGLNRQLKAEASVLTPGVKGFLQSNRHIQDPIQHQDRQDNPGPTFSALGLIGEAKLRPKKETSHVPVDIFKAAQEALEAQNQAALAALSSPMPSITPLRPNLDREGRVLATGGIGHPDSPTRTAAKFKCQVQDPERAEIEEADKCHMQVPRTPSSKLDLEGENLDLDLGVSKASLDFALSPSDNAQDQDQDQVQDEKQDRQEDKDDVESGADVLNLKSLIRDYEAMTPDESLILAREILLPMKQSIENKVLRDSLMDVTITEVRLVVEVASREVESQRVELETSRGMMKRGGARATPILNKSKAGRALKQQEAVLSRLHVYLAQREKDWRRIVGDVIGILQSKGRLGMIVKTGRKESLEEALDRMRLTHHIDIPQFITLTLTLIGG